MKFWKGVLAAGGALVLLAPPVWAHPSSQFHVHSEELMPLVALAVALLSLLLLRRSRSIK